MEFPFNEHIEDGYYIRTFSQDVDEHELVWHRDREDRIIIPLNENDYVDIKTISKEELLKFDLGYTDLGYITFCDNCNGCNTGIKVPVSYEKQGVRDL